MEDRIYKIASAYLELIKKEAELYPAGAVTYEKGNRKYTLTREEAQKSLERSKRIGQLAKKESPSLFQRAVSRIKPYAKDITPKA